MRGNRGSEGRGRWKGGRGNEGALVEAQALEIGCMLGEGWVMCEEWVLGEG